MVSTGWMYPANVETEASKTPYWQNPSNIEEATIPGGASEGGTAIISPVSNCNIPAGWNSDGIKATGYGLNLPLNSRIDGIKAAVLRSGMYCQDVRVAVVTEDGNLMNKAKYHHRTDSLQIYQTYGSSSDKWGSTTLTPAKLNDPDEFGLIVAVNNVYSASLSHYMDVLALDVTYTNPTYSLTSTIPPVALQDSIINYTVTLTATNSVGNGVAIPVSVPIPSGFSLVSASSPNGTYNETTEVWTPILNTSYIATLNLTVTCTGSGVQSQTITETEFNTTTTDSCEILTSDPGSIYYATCAIDDTVTLNNLVNGKTYTLSAYNKVHDTGYAGIYGGIKNNRIAVVNGDEVTGSRVTVQDAYQRVSVSFVYDDTETLTLKLYGQYESVSTVSDDYWAGLCLKQGTDSTYTVAGNLLTDPDALLSTVTPSVITLPSGEDGASYELTFNHPVLTADSPIVTGLMITLTTDDTPGLGIAIGVESESGTSGDIKSKTILTDVDTTTLGGETDLWGLTNQDIEDQELTFTITLSNTTLSGITPAVSDLKLTVYYLDDETWGNLGFTYNGEHSSTYQIYMTSQDNPSGANVKYETLKLTGMDGELITGQSLGAKEITVTFILWGDDVEEVMAKLDAVTLWLSNPLNSIGLPTPYELVFDYDPTRVYNAVLQGEIKVNTKYTTTECTATFLIPEGVAYKTTTTGAVGTNNGLTRIKPVVTVVADGSASIVLSDSVTSQEITLNHTVTSGKLVTFDCDNRTVVDSDGNNLISYIELDSIWFNFTSTYNLTATGGLIQTVTYQEGI